MSQLMKSPVGSIRTYRVDESNVGDDRLSVRGEVTLLRTGRGILVTGRLDTEVDLTCARCLGEFNKPVTLNIEEEFFPTIDVTTGSLVAVPDDEPDAFTIDQNNVLDLTEAVRQYAILATPMKPLCRDDCPGLLTEAPRSK